MKSILNFNAVGDGRTLNTGAIQGAIDACAQGGGGRVLVPPGVYLTGTLRLRSNVFLWLEAGAVIKGSADLADYPPHEFWHNEWKETRSLIYALDEQNLGICGEGTIDLNDEPFFDWGKLRLGVEKPPLEKLADWQRAQAVVQDLPRPNQPVFFHNCRRLKFEGVEFRRSPCWTLTCSACRDVKMRGITIDNHLQVPNNDGIHITACQDVVISGCVIHCGDDCVAVTGITDWERWCENVVVTDCTLISRSAGVRIGHLASKVRNVALSNLVLSDGNRGIGIFAGDGGVVENITGQNLVLHTHLFVGDWWGKGEPLVVSAAESNGRIAGVTLRSVIAHSENGIVIAGKNKNIQDIALVGWRLTLQPGRNRPLLGKIIDLQPAAVRPAPKKQIPWLYAQDAEEIYLEDVRVIASPEMEGEYKVDAVVENVGLEGEG
jgi:polygalacturonase